MYATCMFLLYITPGMHHVNTMGLVSTIQPFRYSIRIRVALTF